MTATPGISFAIPSKYAIHFMQSENNPKQSPQKPRYIGMKMITITPQIRDLFNMQPGSDIEIPSDVHNGSLVIEVAPNSPAEK